ncbi:predicted protein [Streptomyces sp. C]|nr:predicted protein [Streptomyces sp. C]
MNKGGGCGFDTVPRSRTRPSAVPHDPDPGLPKPVQALELLRRARRPPPPGSALPARQALVTYQRAVAARRPEVPSSADLNPWSGSSRPLPVGQGTQPREGGWAGNEVPRRSSEQPPPA